MDAILWQVVNPRREEGELIKYDLLRAGEAVLTGCLHTEAYRHVLEHADSQDTYCEDVGDGLGPVFSLRKLRSDEKWKAAKIVASDRLLEFERLQRRNVELVEKLRLAREREAAAQADRGRLMVETSEMAQRVQAAESRRNEWRAQAVEAAAKLTQVAAYADYYAEARAALERDPAGPRPLEFSQWIAKLPAAAWAAAMDRAWDTAIGWERNEA